MEKDLSKADASSITKSTTLTTITHLLLPLTLFPFVFFVVPPFAAKSSEMGIEISKLTALVFNLSSFICQYWYLFILILGFAAAIDAVICFSLLRFKKKKITRLWSGSVILIEIVFAGLYVTALLSSLHRMSHVHGLCPI